MFKLSLALTALLSFALLVMVSSLLVLSPLRLPRPLTSLNLFPSPLRRSPRQTFRRRSRQTQLRGLHAKPHCQPMLSSYRSSRASSTRETIPLIRRSTIHQRRHPHIGPVGGPPTYTTLQNTTCVLAHDSVEGPYYVNNELVRQDMREDQKEIDLSEHSPFSARLLATAT
jgi:hypothetical protein